MKIFSTSTHAMIDYIAALFFIASPWIFNFDNIAIATWIMIILGVVTIIISLFTDYEGGLLRRIPMRVHLTADIFMGAFLALSPWLLGFAKEVFLPQLGLGLFAAFVGLCTQKRPSDGRSGQALHHT